ncbi:MAG: hypothetical protein ACJA0N_001775 [Pseudohongiellaceae bacterium]|jgi:hypothetical protein
MTTYFNGITNRNLLINAMILGVYTTSFIYIVLITLFGGGLSTLFYVILLPLYIAAFGMIIKKRISITIKNRRMILQVFEFIYFIISIAFTFLMSSFNLQSTYERIQNVSVFTLISILIWWVILIFIKSKNES